MYIIGIIGAHLKMYLTNRLSLLNMNEYTGYVKRRNILLF